MIQVAQLEPPIFVMTEPPPVPLFRVWVAGHPASGNHMYINRKEASGKMKRSKVMTPAASSWLQDVAKATMPWRYPESAPRPLLAVRCVFVGARADVDNLLKVTLDGLKVGLAVDDHYVQRVCAEKVPLAPSRGREKAEKGAWIEVSQLPQPEKPKRAPRPRKPRQARRKVVAA